MIQYHKSFEQTTALTKVCSRIHLDCNDFDGLDHTFFVDTEYSDFQDTPWLYYTTDNEQMVGFLSIYEINRYHSEICIFVLPTYRRRKIATTLFSMMVSDFPSHSFQIAIQPQNDFGRLFVSKMGFVYSSTECSMRLSGHDYVSIPEIISLAPQKQNDQILVQGILENTSIGSAVISVFERTVCIHDIEILSQYRGNGYGYRLVGTLLNHIFEKYDTAILHITKENIPAYNLYEKLGFSCVEILEYYEI